MFKCMHIWKSNIQIYTDLAMKLPSRIQLYLQTCLAFSTHAANALTTAEHSNVWSGLAW